MTKAVILVDKDCQEEEFHYAYYRFQEAKFEVLIATPGAITVYGKYGMPIHGNYDMNKLDTLTADLIYVPGGWSPERVRMNKTAVNFIRKMYEQGKITSFICHGILCGISAGIVQGKKVSGYVGIKDDIINAGGIYTEEVVQDGNLISAAHYRDNPAFMKKLLENIT